MKIWIVNPFDPLPGGQEQLGRYAFLARRLAAAGHVVTWWTSVFSHRFKRELDPAAVAHGAAEAGIRAILLPAPPYRRNISLARLWNHRVLARNFERQAAGAERPNLILASSPPLEMADGAARLGRAWRIPTIIDIQDQWPDNFARAFPRATRVAARVLLAPYYAVERAAYRAADGIIGVAQGYVDRGLAVGGPKRWSGVFPLGVDLADVDAAMQRGRERFGQKWSKPAGQLWLLYSGSLSHNYDFLTIVRAAEAVQREFGDQVRIFISGAGELAGEAQRIVRERGLRNVTLTGFLDFDEWGCILSQADAGFNASFPDALIYLPNKIFYYLAAGAAVLNTIPGECAQIVAEGGCGLTYTAGNVDACVAAIRQLVRDEAGRRAMASASRRLAETRYDRRIVYAGLQALLERIAEEGA